MSEKEQVVGIKPSDLKDIIATAVATAIAETRKPTEKELKAIAAAQEERKIGAAETKARLQMERDFQDICSHAQDRGRDQGKTAMVFINQDFPNLPNGGKYLICQQCGKKVVPGKPGTVNEHFPDFSYDTALFNKHLQMLRFD